MAVRQLTPDEEAKPYAKYYHRPLTPPDPDLIAQSCPTSRSIRSWRCRRSVSATFSTRATMR